MFLLYGINNYYNNHNYIPVNKEAQCYLWSSMADIRHKDWKRKHKQYNRQQRNNEEETEIRSETFDTPVILEHLD